jgi:hypothetical protein
MRTRSHVNGTQRKRMIHTSNFHSIPFISPKKTRGKRQIELSPETSSSPRETPCITNRGERENGELKRGGTRGLENVHTFGLQMLVCGHHETRLFRPFLPPLFCACFPPFAFSPLMSLLSVRCGSAAQVASVRAGQTCRFPQPSSNSHLIIWILSASAGVSLCWLVTNPGFRLVIN